MWQKYFLTSKILHKEEKKILPNSKIQETDLLVSLRIGTWRFTSTNRRKVWAPFACRISNSLWTKVFYISKAAQTIFSNSIFFIGKLPYQTLIQRVVFSDCSRFLKPSLPQQQANTLPPLPPNRFFFTTQILGGHVIFRNQRPSEEKKREPENEVAQRHRHGYTGFH